MSQAILVAIIAGFASAMLSGVFAPGVMSFALLMMIAPLPLFIAGFGWHSLVAALGGLVAAISIDLMLGNRAALAFIGTIAFPTYVLVAMCETLFPAENGEADGLELGRLAMGAVFYVGLLVVLSALWVQPDFAMFSSKMHALVEDMFRGALSGGSGQMPPDMLQRIVRMVSALMLPITALVILSTLVISSTLGIQIAERANRLSWQRPDFRRFRLPGGALIVLGLSMIVAMRDGYVGVFAEIVMLGMLLMLVLQGLAVAHVLTLRQSARVLILSAIWAAVIVFGFPAFLLALLGAADHLLDLRKGRI